MGTVRTVGTDEARRGHAGTRFGWWPLVTVLLCLCAPVPLISQEANLTIYGDGRVVVRRALPIPLQRGANQIVADLGARELDPGTLAPLDEGVSLRGARIVEATGVEGSLRRSLGREVEFLVRDDTAGPRYLRGTLLSLEPVAVRVDGRVRYAFPGAPVFHDSLVQLAPRVELALEATRAHGATRLMYVVQGLTWSASYTVVAPRAGAGPGAAAGTATIRNPGGLSFRGASVQLLAGDVRRAAPPGQPMRMLAGRVAAAQVAEVAEPVEEGVGGTHVYTLPGTLDVVPGETRSVPLFAAATAQIEPGYVLRAQTYGPIREWPDAMRDLHPETRFRVRRAAGTPFGATPLPAGVVRVFQPDSAGRPQLVGEVQIAHTAPGTDLRLTTGTEFDLTATRTQITFERRGDRETISSYRVVLRNPKREGVTVSVQDQFPGSYEVLSSSVPPERLSATLVAFPVRVPAGGETALEYRVRARW